MAAFQNGDRVQINRSNYHATGVQGVMRTQGAPPEWVDAEIIAIRDAPPGIEEQNAYDIRILSGPLTGATGSVGASDLRPAPSSP
jgi:hypothetical protein